MVTFNAMTSAKRFVGIRLSPAGHSHIQAMADRETDGNLSEMIRVLLREATAARMARKERL